MKYDDPIDSVKSDLLEWGEDERECVRERERKL